MAWNLARLGLGGSSWVLGVGPKVDDIGVKSQLFFWGGGSKIGGGVGGPLGFMGAWAKSWVFGVLEISTFNFGFDQVR